MEGSFLSPDGTGVTAPNCSIVSPHMQPANVSLTGLRGEMLQLAMSHTISGEAPPAEIFAELDTTKSGSVVFQDVLSTLSSPLQFAHRDDRPLDARLTLNEFTDFIRVLARRMA